MNLTMNQLGVIDNYNQRVDKYKRVVTVCSAGCLRSPTAAVVLAKKPFNFNTRCAGLTDEYAIIPFTETLFVWADEIVVMEQWIGTEVGSRAKEWGYDMTDISKVINLEIPDKFPYRDPELMQMIKDRYLEEVE